MWIFAVTADLWGFLRTIISWVIRKKFEAANSEPQLWHLINSSNHRNSSYVNTDQASEYWTIGFIVNKCSEDISPTWLRFSGGNVGSPSWNTSCRSSKSTLSTYVLTLQLAGVIHAFNVNFLLNYLLPKHRAKNKLKSSCFKGRTISSLYFFFKPWCLSRSWLAISLYWSLSCWHVSSSLDRIRRASFLLSSLRLHIRNCRNKEQIHMFVRMFSCKVTILTLTN